jgi:uncharacterized C2H2 Zn-finger protein
MTRVICYVLGHEPFIYDALADGTKIRGCPRCGVYVRRDTSDPRPRVNPALWKFRQRVRLRALEGGKAA